MKNDVLVPVSFELYSALADCGGTIQAAIAEYIKNHEKKPEVKTKAPATDAPKAPAPKGITWKPLFLPNGTRFKMTYGGKDHFARVVRGELIYAGESVSPSIFARRAAGNTSRNAWIDLWIKLPKETEWKLADDMRRAVK